MGVWSIPPGGTIRNHVGRVCLETPLATFFTFCEISQRWLQQGARDILVTNNQELCDSKVEFWILRRYMTGKKKKKIYSIDKHFLNVDSGGSILCCCHSNKYSDLPKWQTTHWFLHFTMNAPSTFTHFQGNQSIFTAIGYIPPAPPLPTHTHTLPLPTYLLHLPEPWMAPTHFSGCFACYLLLVPASFIWRFFGHFCFRTFVFRLIFVALTPTPSPLPWWTHYHFSWPLSDFFIKFLNLLHFTLCVLHLCP